METPSHPQFKHRWFAALYLILTALVLLAAAGPQSAGERREECGVLATEDQRAVESQALQVYSSAEVRAQITKSRARFLATPTAADPEARAGIEQAVSELAFAATLNAVNGDPARPKIIWAFTPPRHWLGHEVPGSRWAIDNPDNVYRFAPIDGASRYELKVRPTASQEPPVQYSFLLYDSFVGEDGRAAHLDAPVAALRDEDIRHEADGSFTISIDNSSAEGRANHLRTTPQARVLLVRNTLSDWNTQSPQAVSIRRIDGPEIDAPRDLRKLARSSARLLAAATDTLLGFQTKSASVVANTVAPPFTRGGGWGFAAAGNYHLAADEALVVELDHAGARYVGFDLTDQWLVSRNHIEATGSLNNTQARPNSAGRYTYVISARDPGVANWLDTGGLHSGQFLIRWQRLRAGQSASRAVREVRVVKLTQLPEQLSSVGLAERKSLAALRAGSYARRYLQSAHGAPLAGISQIH